jgi:ABC-2 type transport system permease protein
MAPITVVLMIGFFSSFVVLGNPDGIMGVVGTFVPFWAPFVVPVRSALGVLPLWQSISAVALSLVTIVGLTVLSARVYRGGSLHIGGRLGWRQALRGADT